MGLAWLQATMQDAECPICMERLPEQTSACRLGHIFCSKCIDQAVAHAESSGSHLLCPLCRTDMPNKARPMLATRRHEMVESQRQWAERANAMANTEEQRQQAAGSGCTRLTLRIGNDHCHGCQLAMGGQVRAGHRWVLFVEARAEGGGSASQLVEEVGFDLHPMTISQPTLTKHVRPRRCKESDLRFTASPRYSPRTLGSFDVDVSVRLCTGVVHHFTHSMCLTGNGSGGDMEHTVLVARRRGRPAQRHPQRDHDGGLRLPPLNVSRVH